MVRPVFVNFTTKPLKPSVKVTIQTADPAADTPVKIQYGPPLLLPEGLLFPVMTPVHVFGIEAE